jgi:hypothetical protein
MLTAETLFLHVATPNLSPTPLLKVKISISRACFSAEETRADFFNRIGQMQSVDKQGHVYVHC